MGYFWGGGKMHLHTLAMAVCKIKVTTYVTYLVDSITNTSSKIFAKGCWKMCTGIKQNDLWKNAAPQRCLPFIVCLLLFGGCDVSEYQCICWEKSTTTSMSNMKPVKYTSDDTLNLQNHTRLLLQFQFLPKCTAYRPACVCHAHDAVFWQHWAGNK